MNIKTVHSVYFVGIGGIGMSALARYFHANNKQVAGYDKTPSEITSQLEALGIKVHFDDNVEQIADQFFESRTYLGCLHTSNPQVTC